MNRGRRLRLFMTTPCPGQTLCLLRRGESFASTPGTRVKGGYRSSPFSHVSVCLPLSCQMSAPSKLLLVLVLGPLQPPSWGAPSPIPGGAWGPQPTGLQNGAFRGGRRPSKLLTGAMEIKCLCCCYFKPFQKGTTGTPSPRPEACGPCVQHLVPSRLPHGGGEQKSSAGPAARGWMGTQLCSSPGTPCLQATSETCRGLCQVRATATVLHGHSWTRWSGRQVVPAQATGHEPGLPGAAPGPYVHTRPFHGPFPAMFFSLLYFSVSDFPKVLLRAPERLPGALWEKHVRQRGHLGPEPQR